MLLLIAVTYRLWIPQTAFPPVPLIALPEHLPAIILWCPLLLLIISLVTLALFPYRFSRCWWIVTASFVAAFLLDQHRMQPWAYQSAIYAMVFASMDQSRARRCLIPLAISVYLFSGFGKLDYQFAHTVGQELIGVATRPFGGLPDGVDETIRRDSRCCFRHRNCCWGCA